MGGIGKEGKRGEGEGFIDELGVQQGLVAKFDRRLWLSLVENLEVNRGSEVRVTFKDGTVVGV
jgi:hypothetical protein